jgi:hypothetical protein
LNSFERSAFVYWIEQGQPAEAVRRVYRNMVNPAKRREFLEYVRGFVNAADEYELEFDRVYPLDDAA